MVNQLVLLLILAFLPFAGAAAPQPASGVVNVEIAGTEALPQFGARRFRRLFGTVRGVVRADESIAGLRAVAGGRPAFTYAAAFELIAPVDSRPGDAVLVEAENRGSPVFLSLLADMVPAGDGDPSKLSYPADFGNGFPFRYGISYARVRWQAGIAADVPTSAQGVGEAIVRDFGRLLAGRRHEGGDLPVFAHRILIGASQSAWFVNAFIAEGFNRDPATGRAVFRGAFTRNGAGNLLAINSAARGGRQYPYVSPVVMPLSPRQLLRRPSSDPMLADATSYTDFYRLRASLFAAAPATKGLWRYDLPTPHAPASPASAAVAFTGLHCNGGQAVPLDATRDSPYLRALLVGMARAVGARVAGTGGLPASRSFALTAPGPEARLNALPVARLMVPRAGSNGMPAGGVRTLEAELPLGVPAGALPPVSTGSIDAVCGNLAQWRPFGTEELTQRYGSKASYFARARRVAESLSFAGYLLPDDRDAVLRNLEPSVAKAGLE